MFCQLYMCFYFCLENNASSIIGEMRNGNPFLAQQSALLWWEEFQAWWSHLFNCIWFPLVRRDSGEPFEAPRRFWKLSGYLSCRVLNLLCFIMILMIFHRNWNCWHAWNFPRCLKMSPHRKLTLSHDPSDTEWYWLARAFRKLQPINMDFSGTRASPSNIPSAFEVAFSLYAAIKDFSAATKGTWSILKYAWKKGMPSSLPLLCRSQLFFMQHRRLVVDWNAKMSHTLSRRF